MKTVQIDRINNTNILNKYLNKTMIKINNRLEKGYNLKKNGSLYEKDHKDIYNIINKNKPKNIRCFINSTKYSSWLQTDIYYSSQSDYDPAMQHTTYIKQDLYLFDTSTDFKSNNHKFKTKTNKQIQTALNKKIKLQNKIENLQSELSKLKFENHNFIKS